jgi:hypothetical protein
MAQQADNSAIDPRLLKWMEDRNRFAEQNEDGVDLTLIEENLKLSPDQRLQQNYDQVQGVLWIQRHARRVR